MRRVCKVHGVGVHLVWPLTVPEMLHLFIATVPPWTSTPPPFIAALLCTLVSSRIALPASILTPPAYDIHLLPLCLIWELLIVTSASSPLMLPGTVGVVWVDLTAVSQGSLGRSRDGREAASKEQSRVRGERRSWVRSPLRTSAPPP